MNGWKQRIPAPVLRVGSQFPAILGCLLLAGCAAPPQAVHQTAEPPVSAAAPSLPGPSPAVVPAEHVEPSVAGGEPVLTFEKVLHDFGPVGPQSKHVCQFRFKNTGTGTLRIRQKIDSTCGCTVPVLSQTEYAPGEEGVIQVTYVAGPAGSTATKVITVHSNDKNPGAGVHLTIRATVVERVACEPRHLRLRLQGPDTACPPLTIRSLDHRSFAVTRILSSGGAITADFDPSLQATEFTFRPRLDAGQLQKYPTGTLLLTLTHPECEEVRIAYQVIPEFEFSPPSITLFGADPNRPVQREVWLSNNYGQAFEIASCTSTANLVQVTEKERVVAPDAQNVRYRLQLSIHPRPRSGTQRVFEDTLSVRLTNGSLLQFPCRIFYGGPGVPLRNVRVLPH